MSRSKSKKTRKASTTSRIQWKKHSYKPNQQYQGSKPETVWRCDDALVGVSANIHFDKTMGTDMYHWSLYANQAHRRPNGLKQGMQLRFGNHYYGSELTLNAAKQQSRKAIVALFVRILLHQWNHEPESMNWPPKDDK